VRPSTSHLAHTSFLLSSLFHPLLHPSSATLTHSQAPSPPPHSATVSSKMPANRQKVVSHGFERIVLAAPYFSPPLLCSRCILRISSFSTPSPRIRPQGLVGYYSALLTAADDAGAERMMVAAISSPASSTLPYRSPRRSSLFSRTYRTRAPAISCFLNNYMTHADCRSNYARRNLVSHHHRARPQAKCRNTASSRPRTRRNPQRPPPTTLPFSRV
jgi:hypothetical protein